jgi:hypothetical protein
MMCGGRPGAISAMANRIALAPMSSTATNSGGAASGRGRGLEDMFPFSVAMIPDGREREWSAA